MASASEVFSRALRSVVRPGIQARGFVFDGSRTFRRVMPGGDVAQIINFQLGQRSLEGKFAVNLGVYVRGEVGANPDELTAEKAFEYHCSTPRRTRLGTLIPARIPALENVPLLGALFGPQDVWWVFSDDPARTEASLRTAVDVLERHGYSWLDGATPGGGATPSSPS